MCYAVKHLSSWASEMYNIFGVSMYWKMGFFFIPKFVYICLSWLWKENMQIYPCFLIMMVIFKLFNHISFFFQKLMVAHYVSNGVKWKCTCNCFSDNWSQCSEHIWWTKSVMLCCFAVVTVNCPYTSSCCISTCPYLCKSCSRTWRRAWWVDLNWYWGNALCLWNIYLSISMSIT